MKRKGVRCHLDIESYSNENIIVYVEHNTSLEINRRNEPSLCKLITSNWTELKLTYQPKDKELVWAWDDVDKCQKLLNFYDANNNCLFYSNGKRNGYPEWAKEAFNNLED